MRNPLCVLHDRHPRIWCVTIFIPMVLITIIIVPIVFLYEGIADTPRMLSNLWSDIRGCFLHNLQICKDVVGVAWRYWIAGWKGENK